MWCLNYLLFIVISTKKKNWIDINVKMHNKYIKLLRLHERSWIWNDRYSPLFSEIPQPLLQIMIHQFVFSAKKARELKIGRTIVFLTRQHWVKRSGWTWFRWVWSNSTNQPDQLATQLDLSSFSISGHINLSTFPSLHIETKENHI